jgi:hypothetical protein
LERGREWPKDGTGRGQRTAEISTKDRCENGWDGTDDEPGVHPRTIVEDPVTTLLPVEAERFDDERVCGRIAIGFLLRSELVGSVKVVFDGGDI